MKRIASISCCIMIAVILTACSGRGKIQLPIERPGISEGPDGTQAYFEPWGNVAEGNALQNILITVDGREFPAKLYDNEAAGAFAEMLPLTLDMSELNGNEKYFYLSDDLPADSKVPAAIHTGDLMLFSSNCLVLFYQGHTTAYSYTPLGYVEDAGGLAGALGGGGVQVSFSIGE